MSRYLAGKIGGALAAIFGASIIAFLILRIVPGDPARTIVGPFASDEVVHQEHVALGLDRPVHVQYWEFVKDFFTGSWGFSYSIGEPVRTMFGQRLPASIELGLYAFGFGVIGAVIFALISTYRRRRLVDGFVQGSAFVGLGTPPFWLGLLGLWLLSGIFHIFPGPEGRLSPNTAAPPSYTGLYTVDSLIAGEWGTFGDALWHLILPAFVLGFAAYAFLVRLLRTNLLETSREPFLGVARSKGLSRWTAFRRHALPNAALPALTAAGLIFAQLIGGSVLVESVFNWPGIGQAVSSAILAKDFAVVETFILLSAVLYVVINLVVDSLYGVIDPRVRSGGGVGRG